MWTYLNSEEKGEEDLYCRKKTPNLKQGATHLALAVHARNGLQSAHWVLKTVKSICTWEKTPWEDKHNTKIRISNRESVKIYLRKTSPTTVQLELWAHHTVTVSLGTLWEGSKRFSTSFFQEFRIIRECNGSISGSAPIELYLALRILQVTKRATARYETSCVRQ